MEKYEITGILETFEFKTMSTGREFVEFLLTEVPIPEKYKPNLLQFQSWRDSVGDAIKGGIRPGDRVVVTFRLAGSYSEKTEKHYLNANVLEIRRAVNLGEGIRQAVKKPTEEAEEAGGETTPF